MGRPSGARAQKRQLSSTLRIELERQIEQGECAYCRAPARPNRPLTREHVIPRARGGRRNDIRIIVPACARCNQHRGCRELIPFLLARPQRISAFLDYLAALSSESIRELDLRIFAELYVAVGIINECAAHGSQWKSEMERLCSGRSLHRRRYAARRAVGAVSNRLASQGDMNSGIHGPSCLLPAPRTDVLPILLEEPLERLASRTLSVLALLWQVSAEVAERELARELSGTAIGAEPLVEALSNPGSADELPEGVFPLDGWKVRSKRKRLRVDRRQGRAVRTQKPAGTARGRAA